MGGNVAYHDYMKTVLTKEEVESVLPPTASAEYTGDIFEFWLGMLELGIESSSLQCLEDGGQTLTAASLDWRSRSGFSAIHAAMQTPSTRSGIDQGRHTYH